MVGLLVQFILSIDHRTFKIFTSFPHNLLDLLHFNTYITAQSIYCLLVYRSGSLT